MTVVTTDAFLAEFDASICRLVVDQTTAYGQRFHLTRTLARPDQGCFNILHGPVLHALGYGVYRSGSVRVVARYALMYRPFPSFLRALATGSVR